MDFHSITPYLIVRGGNDAIRFYREAFGADELYRGTTPEGDRVLHSELLVGNSRFFVKDEVPEWGAVAPQSWSSTLYLYVDDAESTFTKAVAAGATSITPVAECMWGDRCGMVKDPFGHVWAIATRVEDLSPEDMQRRGGAAPYISPPK